MADPDLSLSGEHWRLYSGPLRPPGSTLRPNLADAAPAGPARVPGNVQTQIGLANPWLDTPEVTTLNDREWLYTTCFRTPTGMREPEHRIFLEFDGVDYFCDVWLNGEHVGHHEGAFSTFECEIGSSLRPPDGDNELIVAVSCPWRIDARSFHLRPSTVPSPTMTDSEYMKGNLLHYWDALALSGRAVLPFGLWGDVRLAQRSGILLRRISVLTVTVSGREAELELCCEWWNGHLGPRELVIECQVEPETFDGETLRFERRVVIEPGDGETRSRFTIDEPQLWWTWDSGRPDLYRIAVSASGWASAEGVFGIRSLTRDEETLTYQLNGRRLFLRGAWYPFASIFNGSTARLEHQRDAELLRGANMNHVVVFTFVEPEALYDACDRLGIMIFQQLPFAQFGPMNLIEPDHPRHGAYTQWALGEVRNIIRQRRGHTSLVLWAAFAETRRAGRWVWGEYTDFVEGIGHVVQEQDPGALYHPSFCDNGEEHIWNGAFGFGEFSDHYDRNPRFVSEFGAIAPPVVETLGELIPPSAIWDCAEHGGRVGLPIDVGEYSYHWAFDYAGLCSSVARMFHYADRSPATLQRFVDALQWYQAFGLKYCAEVYRRRRFNDVAGCRTWSFRDVAPGIKATVVDHRQRPKMGYFALQAAYAPLLLSLDDGQPLAAQAAGSSYVRDLWLVNDSATSESLQVSACLHGLDGRVLRSWDREVMAPADASTLLGTIELGLPQTPGAYLFRLVARRPDGTEATANDTWLRLVRPAFDTPLRLLMLGQRRYNEPVLEALAAAPGIQITVVDERTRHPQDSTWSEGLVDRFDVLWFSGWDGAAHQFRAQEFGNIASAVALGLGFVHTGGQGSFHGGDGRGALLDCTALGDVLPVRLRPHDGASDTIRPQIRAGRSRAGGFGRLSTLPVRGFSRTDAKSGSRVRSTIDGWPLLVTGRSGIGATVAFTASFTEPLQLVSMSEEDDRFWTEAATVVAGSDPGYTPEVEAHWLRADIRAYGPYWNGLLEFALGCLAFAGRREPAAPPAELADEYGQPIFELLAQSPVTHLACEIVGLEWDEQRAETRGMVRVENAGTQVARLVRGAVISSATSDHRVLDGFFDMLPGETRQLRFEAGCPPGDVGKVVVSGQNAAAVEVACAGRMI